MVYFRLHMELFLSVYWITKIPASLQLFDIMYILTCTTSKYDFQCLHNCVFKKTGLWNYVP